MSLVNNLESDNNEFMASTNTKESNGPRIDPCYMLKPSV